jgi:uncharacterized membrane protein
MQASPVDPTPVRAPRSSLRRAIWRGTSIIAPPLVTLVLLIWIGSAVEQYVLHPLETGTRTVLVWATSDIRSVPPPEADLIDASDPTKGFTYQGSEYIQPPIGRKFLPDHIIGFVDANLDRLPRDMQRPLSASNYYNAYFKLRYMPRWFTIPLLLLVLLSVLYFVGRFLAAGVGRLFVNAFEGAINQLPLIRNLYSSVKQVTDFVLSEREIEFTRVVAVEYPRVGIWSVGFVTSDSLPSLRSHLGEELVSIFIPTSPMPMTGFTINVRKRETIDMELTVDQAIQFIVSCGVVCPLPTSARLRGGTLPRLSSLDDESTSQGPYEDDAS